MTMTGLSGPGRTGWILTIVVTPEHVRSCSDLEENSAAQIRPRRGDRGTGPLYSADEARTQQLGGRRIVGVGRKTGSHWRNGRTVRDPVTGRVRAHPAIMLVREQPDTISARYLSEDERVNIADRHRAGESVRSIAAVLGRAPSTVNRELRRNRNLAGQYRPHYAQKKARLHRQRPRAGKIAERPELQAFIQTMLDRWWSPGLICRQLRKVFPNRKDLHVVHETIYQALYIKGRGGLSRELVKCLRTGRDLRKHNRAIPRRTSRFAGEVLMIATPPVCGGWPGALGG